MNLAHLRRLLCFAVLLLAGCGESTNQPLESAAPAQPDARAIHDSLLTLDTHVDIPLNFATDDVDPLDADLQVNLNKMRAGGLDAAFFIVYVGQTARTPENYIAAQKDAMTKFKAIHRMTDDLYPEQIGLAYRADDVERLVGEGKLAAAIGIENGYVIGKDLSLLDRYYRLGARYMTLVHNGHNDIGDSAQPRKDLGDGPTEHNGLSEFGAQVVERMNELGIMVDVSHVSKQTALDAIRLSRAPVIASHSSVRALVDHPRNMDDETLLALQKNGGVIQVVAFDSYVKSQPKEKRDALQALRDEFGLDERTGPSSLPQDTRARYEQAMRDIDARWPPATVEDFVDHIDYAVKLIGIDHVGISSDFGGGGGIVGWQNASETPNVTAELIRRGYKKEDLAKLWGGNLLRVWREVEEVAARSAAGAATGEGQ